METPYGPCHHTNYDGSPPCIHTAYLRGFEDGQRRQIAAELLREAQDAGLYDTFVDKRDISVCRRMARSQEPA